MPCVHPIGTSALYCHFLKVILDIFSALVRERRFISLLCLCVLLCLLLFVLCCLSACYLSPSLFALHFLSLVCFFFQATIFFYVQFFFLDNPSALYITFSPFRTPFLSLSLSLSFDPLKHFIVFESRVMLHHKGEWGFCTLKCF